MITLPLYIIEHVLGKWVIYNTEDCSVIEFETKEQAEEKLKTLTK